MDNKTQAQLINLTSDFYSKVADSFSDTRQNAWAGWEKVMEAIDLPSNYSLLDVACGNLRFEKFLQEKEQIPASAICVDNCAVLLPEDPPSFVKFHNIDLFSEKLTFQVDFAVRFGFMHHIPSFERRKNFLLMLMNNVSSSGYVALSFWQFMNDERIARKATNITQGCNFAIDDGDYLLGWKDRDDAYRYCHNFSDSEIDELLKDFCVIDVFVEDGKSHNLNKYAILKRQ